LKPDQKFEAYLKLSEFRRQRIAHRSQFEWRLTLALWALLAAAPLYVRPRPDEMLLGLTLSAVVVVYTFLLVLPIQGRDEDDWAFAFYYVLKAEHLLDSSVITKDRPPAFDGKKLFWRDAKVVFSGKSWAAIVQIGTTVLLALVAFYMIGRTGSA